MGYTFYLNSGSRKPSDTTLEKFFMFFVIGGKEKSFYEMKKLGMVSPSGPSNQYNGITITGDFDVFRDTYTTNIQIVKIFISVQGFGIQKRYVAFYLQLLAPPAKKIKIIPFHLKGAPASPFYFEAYARIVPKREIEKYITDVKTLEFLNRQPVLPKEILRSLISIDKEALRTNVRKIRMLSDKK